MAAYYNEIDPYAAQWLRNLIAAGHIAPGDVDERDIQDVRPDDLRGYTQCHFFAGIGVWSLALRRAGWADDRPVWTGSCPCQPFSAAGKGLAFDDERHLWPAWFHLISECRPAVILGEQVASKDADAWLDLVQADLEGVDHAFGCEPFPSAGIGAPHIRDRNYWASVRGNRRSVVSGGDLQWLANSNGCVGGEERSHVRGRITGGNAQSRSGLGSGGMLGGMAYADDSRSQGWRGMPERAVECAAGARGLAVGLADTNGGDARAEREQSGRQHRQQPSDGHSAIWVGDAHSEPQRGNDRGEGSPSRGTESEMGGADGQRHGFVDVRAGSPERAAGPVNGFWRDADWLFCRDGKWRPVEPGTFPLAHGATARVGRLRAYGNAINAIQAQIWCEIVMEALS